MAPKNQGKSLKANTATLPGQAAAPGDLDVVMSEGGTAQVVKAGSGFGELGQSNDQQDEQNKTAAEKNLTIASIVDGSGNALKDLQIQDNCSEGDHSTGKKRKAEDDGVVDESNKHARVEDDVEPCCTHCAMWYNIFPHVLLDVTEFLPC